MTNSTHDAPTVGLGYILREGTTYHVPDHQRDYSWTVDEVEQFVADIEDARSSDQDEYFTGLMVFLSHKAGQLTILDGQQRMATAVILLSAIRTWLRDNGYDAEAAQIQNDYIAVQELGEDEVKPRLVLNENNKRTTMRPLSTSLSM